MSPTSWPGRPKRSRTPVRPRSGKTTALAWAEARRARRPLRIVMSAHWDQAWAAFTRAAESINPEGPKEEDEAPKRVDRNPKVKLDAPLQLLPISCPPCISFYTLPESYIWIDWIKGRPGY